MEELVCEKNHLTKLILPPNNELKFLDCSNNQLTSLDLSNCSKLERLWCHDNKITELIISSSQQLTELACYSNQLTKLALPTDNKIKSIYAFDNLLTTFDYDQLNQDTLTLLSIDNNNLAETDIKVFSRLVNLERLGISNFEDRVIQGIFNRWTNLLQGSQGFCELKKLKELNIENTELVIEPEQLPESLEKFHYSQREVPEEKVNSITERILDKAYLDKSIKELNINSQKLKGHLDCKGYSNLERLNCAGNGLISLKVDDCEDLAELDCANNQIINLSLGKKKKLKKLDCWGNKLTELDIDSFISSLPISLTELDLGCCSKLENKDLSIFSHLLNLEKLNLANTRIKGNCESLKNLSGLKLLDISQTNVAAGLEYLPESLTELRCLGTKLAEQLEEITGRPKINDYIPLLWEWKKAILLIKTESRIQTELTKTGLANKQLNQQLFSDNHFDRFTQSWANYLSRALNLNDLNMRKSNILTSLKNLNESIVKDQQIQLLQVQQELFTKKRKRN